MIRASCTRNSSGYILSGPEYLTIFNGQTGAAMVTTNFYPDRVNVTQWGDNYGNRVDRFLAGVAYLDGQRPSLIMARGYYGPQSGYSARNEITAWNWRGGQLSRLWWFKAGLEHQQQHQQRLYRPGRPQPDRRGRGWRWQR